MDNTDNARRYDNPAWNEGPADLSDFDHLTADDDAAGYDAPTRQRRAPVEHMSESDSHRVGAHDDIRSTSCPECIAAPAARFYDLERGQQRSAPAPVEPFTDDECAEIKRITADLRVAIDAARDALDRLPWTSDAERNAAVAKIVDDACTPGLIVPVSPVTVEPDTGRYHRAVRIGDDTIGYIAARGREAWIAWDERMVPIETSGDAHQGMWYTADAAARAVTDAFHATRGALS